MNYSFCCIILYYNLFIMNLLWTIMNLLLFIIIYYQLLSIIMNLLWVIYSIVLYFIMDYLYDLLGIYYYS